MAIAELVNQGHIKKIISQNVDNLHRKSRIPKHKIVELHGNICVEECEKCRT
jgi:mono-ADP-ribosyltransferase sirtuin 6